MYIHSLQYIIIIIIIAIEYYEISNCNVVEISSNRAIYGWPAVIIYCNELYIHSLYDQFRLVPILTNITVIIVTTAN